MNCYLDKHLKMVEHKVIQTMIVHIRNKPSVVHYVVFYCPSCESMVLMYRQNHNEWSMVVNSLEVPL